MQLTPNSWGSPLREFNPCHGPQDGKFCSTAGAVPYADATPAVGAALGLAKAELQAASRFNRADAEWRESALAVSELGVRSQVLFGERDVVNVTPLRKVLNGFYSRHVGRPGDAAMVHTHPSSSAFSFGDLAGLVSLNDRVTGPGPPWMVAPRSIVFGQDGSVYELKLKRRLTQQDVTRLEYAYQDIRDAMVPVFQRTVEDWAQKLPGSPFAWQPTPHPGGFPRLIDRSSGYPVSQNIVTKFAESADAAGFERFRRREWKRASVSIWRELQREHPDLFEFRYKLEDM